MALFQAYGTAVQPFRTVIENTPQPNAFTTMAKLDQEKTCHLNYAADMVRGLTDGLKKLEQVDACHGFVTAANLSDKVRSGLISILAGFKANAYFVLDFKCG